MINYRARVVSSGYETRAREVPSQDGGMGHESSKMEDLQDIRSGSRLELMKEERKVEVDYWDIGDWVPGKSIDWVNSTGGEAGEC